jgi:hypothetical protein
MIAASLIPLLLVHHHLEQIADLAVVAGYPRSGLSDLGLIRAQYKPMKYPNPLTL